MGGAFWRGESREVVICTIIAWLKMEDACILYNVIEFFDREK